MSDALTVLLVGAIANGLVTWGVVRATLHFLIDGVKEAKASAASAHERIDGILMERGR